MQFDKRIFLVLVVWLIPAMPASAEGDWSFGAGIGSSKIDDFCDLFGAGISCDDTDTAVKFYVGRDVNENFRIEGFWIDLGEAEATDSFGDSVSVEANGFGLAFMPMAPASERFDIFGKLGLFMWDADATANIGGSIGTASDDGTDPFIGFGGRYRFDDQASMRAEWEQFDLDGDDITVMSIAIELHY